MDVMNQPGRGRPDSEPLLEAWRDDPVATEDMLRFAPIAWESVRRGASSAFVHASDRVTRVDMTRAIRRRLPYRRDPASSPPRSETHRRRGRYGLSAAALGRSLA
jgi:hypothetical protein